MLTYVDYTMAELIELRASFRAECDLFRKSAIYLSGPARRQSLSDAADRDESIVAIDAEIGRR